MSSKLALFLIGTLALSSVSVATAESRRHRDDDRRGDRHGRVVRSHDDRRGDRHGRVARYHDDRRGHDRRVDHVWSHRSPRAHYYAHRMPPPRRHEWRAHRPSYRHVWIPGYWSWRPGYADWYWMGGYWGVPPRAGVVYVAPSYSSVGTRVEYVEGGWCDSGYANDGAAAGAVLGGVAGGIIGHQSKETGAGVLLGALVGSVIGHQADRQREENRADRIQIEQERVAAQTAQEQEARIALGQQTGDEELAAAQERARVAKAKLAAAKAERSAALGRATALERAQAEAAAAEAELAELEQ